MRYSLPSRLVALVALLALVGCASTNTDVGDAAPADAPASEESADHDPNRVDAEDLEGRYIARIEEMLRGQVAGVSVRDTGQGLVIRIRGASSIYGSSDPLFIVDGLPIELGMNGALTGINPRDVETIQVLKNASDTAMYGSRGANGVVLITTKRTAAPAPDDDAEGDTHGETAGTART